jgi:hypothetical protein
MRYYFEAKYEDRYTGLITMYDGRVMEYRHTQGPTGPEPYLMDVETGEAYPVVVVVTDGETEIYVTEV